MMRGIHIGERESVKELLLLLPRSSNGLSTPHNKGSSALQVLQAAVQFLAHGCWVLKNERDLFQW